MDAPVTVRPLVVGFMSGGGFLRRDYLDDPVAAAPDKAAG